MKRLLLGSLLSCLFGNQILGAEIQKPDAEPSNQISHVDKASATWAGFLAGFHTPMLFLGGILYCFRDPAPIVLTLGSGAFVLKNCYDLKNTKENPYKWWSNLGWTVGSSCITALLARASWMNNC